MITLYTFGPAWGLPDPSPFVTKAAILLKMAGLPFQTDTKGFRNAPRGKLPYIRDGETVISDSTLIRFYLEQHYEFDFDHGLSPQERGFAWAVEKMCEDHLYWLIVHALWIDSANFERGPARFFKAVPAPIRPFMKSMIRSKTRRTVHGQGIGRYTEAERAMLAGRAFASISAILGDKPYLMGDAPCGADASIFGFVAGSLCPLFESALRSHAEAYPNLLNYATRLSQQYFPSGTVG